MLEQAVQCRAGVLLTDDTLCKAFQAAFMLGDPVAKPKEYGDIMGYYSRQVRCCPRCSRTVWWSGLVAMCPREATDCDAVGCCSQQAVRALHSLHCP